MTIFIKKNNLVFKLAVILVLIMAGFYFAYASKGEQPDRKDPKPETGTLSPKVGVISYEELIPFHPDYKQLQQLDQEIAKIGPSPFDPTEIQNLNDALIKKMQDYQKQLEGMLAKERDRIQNESASKAKALNEKLESAFQRKKREFEDFQAKVEKEYAQQQADPDRQLSGWEKEFRTRVEKYSTDLVMLKERQVASKQLELSKRAQEKLMADSNSLKQQLSDYEDEVRRSNQNAKLDLQLKIQVAKDDEERAQIDNQLKQLFDEERQKVEVKRNELDAIFQEKESQEKARNNEELNQYKARLDADVDKQLDGIKQKVTNELISEGVKRGEANPFVPKELKDKLEARHNQMQREMEALQSEIRPQLEAIQAQAEQEFESRRKEIMSKMESYQKALGDEFEKKKQEMINELQTANEEKHKTMLKLKDQREKLYKQIVDEINQEVEVIAKQEKIDLVVGNYVVNIEAADLTDLARNAIRNMDKPESSPSDKGTGKKPSN